MQVFVDALSIRKLYLQVYHYHFSSFFFLLPSFIAIG